MSEPTIIFAGPSGILMAPRGVRLSSDMAADIRSQWTAADGRVILLAHGWRFRQRLPDGTFEPEVRDFPDEFYAPQAVLSEPLTVKRDLLPYVFVTLGGLTALIAVLAR